MFITPFRFILKTCGQTTLLHALPKLLEYAAGVGLPKIQVRGASFRIRFPLDYSVLDPRANLCRRCSFRATTSVGPKSSTTPTSRLATKSNTSTATLVRIMRVGARRLLCTHRLHGCPSRPTNSQHTDGKAFSLGRINDNDTCYLYTLDNHHDFAPVPEQADQTLEILMSELDPTAMVPFYKSETVTTFEQASIMSGISALFPEAKLDGHLFEPCGYSVNAMIGPYYFTIHITPQPGFSYASFETDFPLEDYSELTSRVLAIFRPGRSTVTVMANHAARHPARIPRRLDEYVVGDVQHQELAQYKIVYARLRKASSERRATPPRLSPRPLPIQTSA
jgi:hypothetical protein